MDMERFNLKNLNEREVKEQYQVTIKSKFAALENLPVENNGDISRSWDTVRENIQILTNESIGRCEWKHHKLWFDEECSKLVDGRKQAKLQWLSYPNELNDDSLSNVSPTV
jgi:hypothetical protein